MLDNRGFIGLNYLILFSAALVTAIIVAYYIISMTTTATNTPVVINEGEAVLAYYNKAWHLYVTLKNLGGKSVEIKKVIINNIGEYDISVTINPRESKVIELQITSVNIQPGDVYDIVIIYSGGSISIKARALGT